MSDYELEAREVASHARGRWDSIYASLAPKLGEAIAKKGRHVACPVHGGTDGFRLHKTGDAGQGICNTCQAFVRHGERQWLDGLGILMWVTGDSFPRVLEDVASIVAPHLLDKRNGTAKRRTAPPPVYVPPPRTREMVEQDKALVQRMRETWEKAIPMTDGRAALAWRYLESRGLPVPREMEGIWDSVRFVPSLYYRDTATDVTDHFPAIVAVLRNPKGSVRGVHRTYLARDGWGKAPVDNPKKLMGKPESISLAGCAVRLGPPGRVIGAAEGFETALAVRAFTGFSVWSTVNATLMRQFRPPEGTVGVHLFGDLDRSEEGQNAMNDEAAALRNLGYQVRADLPPGPVPVGAKGVDWLNVYNQHGKNAIKLVESLRDAASRRVVVPFHDAGRRRAG
ncbi:DUF7146 domain-containing protein [Rhodanobacter sp. FW106-PBR-R2A-1-13]|uniref:DUF7146 domain-containing protein n=1 Tax=Rhodanobacter sp. FW106-PBR-R2A-1-13 TaxID=3454845 RepID=UPI0034E520CC